MTFKGRVRQIAKKWKELIRRQHTLIDNDIGRQRAHVEKVRLFDTLVCANQMGTVLANGVQLALKGLIFHTADRALADKQLFERRHGGPGCLAHVGEVCIGWQFAPADKRLTCIFDGLLDNGLALRALGGIGG